MKQVLPLLFYFLWNNLLPKKAQRMTTKLLSFFLIGSRASEWLPTLNNALQAMGALRTIEPDSFSSFSPASLSSSLSVSLPLSDESTLFIIDATYVEDVPSMIQHIRMRYPHPRVLVVTSAPSWSRARDALKAGAVDYIKKSLDAECVRQSIQLALQKTLPVAV